MNISDIRVCELMLVIKIHQVLGSVARKINRPDCGIIFGVCGELCFEHNGKSFILDNRHALFVPDQTTYYFHCDAESIAYVINFTTMQSPGIDTFYRFDIGNVNKLLPRLERINALWNFQETSYMLRSIGIVYELLSAMNEAGHSGKYAPNSRYDRIKDSVRYLEAHFDEPTLSNRLLAEISGISEVYFRKLFTEHYGVPPMSFIRQKRMQKAKMMLLSGFASVSEVAENVGYESIYAFSKAFKNETGASPREFIQNEGRVHIDNSR